MLRALRCGRSGRLDGLAVSYGVSNLLTIESGCDGWCPVARIDLARPDNVVRALRVFDIPRFGGRELICATV